MQISELGDNWLYYADYLVNKSQTNYITDIMFNKVKGFIKPFSSSQRQTFHHNPRHNITFWNFVEGVRKNLEGGE